MAQLAEEAAADGGLHHEAEFEAVGLGMRAHDLQSVHLRHALLVHDARLETLRAGRAAVRAREIKGWAAARHHDAAHAAALQADPPDAVERHAHGGREPVGAPREIDHAVRGFRHGTLDGRGVVGDAVALGAEILHAGRAGETSRDQKH